MFLIYDLCVDWYLAIENAWQKLWIGTRMKWGQKRLKNTFKRTAITMTRSHARPLCAHSEVHREAKNVSYLCVSRSFTGQFDCPRCVYIFHRRYPAELLNATCNSLLITCFLHLFFSVNFVVYSYFVHIQWLCLERTNEIKKRNIKNKKAIITNDKTRNKNEKCWTFQEKQISHSELLNMHNWLIYFCCCCCCFGCNCYEQSREYSFSGHFMLTKIRKPSIHWLNVRFS